MNGGKKLGINWQVDLLRVWMRGVSDSRMTPRLKGELSFEWFTLVLLIRHPSSSV